MVALVPIHKTMGVMFIGAMLGGFLYPRDSFYLKSLVGVTWVLDTLHTVFLSHMVYIYLVTNFGDYIALGYNIWSFNLHVLLTFLVDKGKINTVFSGIILLLAIVQIVDYAFSVRINMYCPHLSGLQFHRILKIYKHKWLVDTWLGSAAICDIFVSAAVVRSLWKSRTGMRSTNHLINNLIVWTVNAGILTSAWAILDIILFTASTDTLIHDLFNVMLAKLLNHRRATNPLDESSAQTQNISLTALNRSRGGHSRDAENKIPSENQPFALHCSDSGKSLRFENEKNIKELELGAKV
ncbi:hypothetical protein BU17DRAFT_61895 [Hysterangium stoloniferum]|nr:hypothetical protein BU17DRAFT_61895 [Hysterangium stoloniferum]